MMKISKTLKNKKGFTLVEVIVTITILAILAGVVLPGMTGWVDNSKEKVCLINRSQIVRFYQATAAYRYAENEAVTLSKTLAGDYEECARDVAGCVCPCGGTYTADDATGTLTCSYHDGGVTGGVIVPNPPTVTGGSSGGSQPTTLLPLSGGGWPTLDMFDDYGNYYFHKGEVFVHDGETYVLIKDCSVYKNVQAGGPQGILNWDYLERLTGTVYDSSTELRYGQLVQATAGDLYRTDDGHYYVFTPNSGGYANMPPQNNPNMWTLVQ